MEISMFDKFTDSSKKVIMRTQKEAQQLTHKSIGTGHVLLSILKCDNGITSHILRKFDLKYYFVRNEVKQKVDISPEILVDRVPNMPAATKELFQLAHEEATSLNHDYIGTEHLLLAILRIEHCLAAKIIRSYTDLQSVRIEILGALLKENKDTIIDSESESKRLFEIARKDGIQEGIKIERFKTAKKMYYYGLSSDQIMSFTGFSARDVLSNIQNELIGHNYTHQFA
jgi:ATP-dependent Clp protease ATP-binding subunit ClpC